MRLRLDCQTGVNGHRWSGTLDTHLIDAMDAQEHGFAHLPGAIDAFRPSSRFNLRQRVRGGNCMGETLVCEHDRQTHST